MSTDTSVTDGGEREPRLSALLLDIFASPRNAFAALALRPMVLWPLLAFTIGNGLLVCLYYLEVDFVWMLETTFEAQGRQVPPELSRGGGTAQAMGLVTGTMGGISTGIFVLVVMLLFAGYLSLVSLLTSDGIPYKRWLALVAWSAVPTLLDTLAGLVNLVLNDFTHRLPAEINVLSFGSLLGIDPAAVGWLETLAHQVSITTIWAIVLMVLGYEIWTGKSAGAALGIVTAPLLVIIGIRIVIAVL